MKKSTLLGLTAGLAMMATAASAQEAPYTLSPRPDEGAVKDLQFVSVTFPEKNVEVYENSRMPMATLVNNTTGDQYYCQTLDQNTFAETEGIQFTMTFVNELTEESAPITNAGDYTLSIRGLYYVDSEGNYTKDVPLINADYTINYPVSYIITPAPGEVTTLNPVTLEFPNNRNIGFYSGNRMPVATLVNVETGEEFVCTEAERDVRAMSEGAVYTLTFVAADNGNDADENTEGENTEPGVQDAALITPGHYQLTIRAFGYEEDGEITEDLEPIVVKYEVTYPYTYILNPEEGEVTNLTTVTLTFPANPLIGYYDNTTIATIENLVTGDTFVCAEPLKNFTQEGGTILTFAFKEDENAPEEVTITEPGSYLLSVRGLYNTEDYDAETGEGTNVVLPVITAAYTINYPYAYNLDPMPGKVSSISEITLSFPETTNIGFDGARFIMNYNDQDYVGVATKNTYAQGSEFTIVFYEDEVAAAQGGEDTKKFSEPGEYNLIISGLERTLIGDNDEETTEYLPAIYATYNVVFPFNYVLTPAEGSTVKSFESVTLNFTDQFVGFYENNQMPTVVLEYVGPTGETKTYIGDTNRDPRATTEGVAYNIVFTEEGEETPVSVIEDEGTYYLTVKALCYYPYANEDGDGEAVELPIINAIFYVNPNATKVEQLNQVVEFSGVNVYNLQGVQVVRNGSNADLNKLANGIYIVNGKKVVIRK